MSMVEVKQKPKESSDFINVEIRFLGRKIFIESTADQKADVDAADRFAHLLNEFIFKGK